MRFKFRRKRKNDGAQILEFSIMLILFIFLFLIPGINLIIFGFAFSKAQLLVNEAANEAAMAESRQVAGEALYYLEDKLANPIWSSLNIVEPIGKVERATDASRLKKRYAKYVQYFGDEESEEKKAHPLRSKYVTNHTEEAQGKQVKEAKKKLERATIGILISEYDNASNNELFPIDEPLPDEKMPSHENNSTQYEYLYEVRAPIKIKPFLNLSGVPGVNLIPIVGAPINVELTSSARVEHFRSLNR